MSTLDSSRTNEVEVKSRMSPALQPGRTPRIARNVGAVNAFVAGAGALGNEVIRALGLLGARHVVVVDPDSIESTNLTSSLFFRQSDCLGRNKATALVHAARALFPETGFDAIETEIADVGFGCFSGADILFSCVDSDLARLEIAYISSKLGIPVADAGLGALDWRCGRVSWFPSSTGACFGCKLTPRKLRDLLTYWNATVRPCSGAEDQIPNTSTPTLAAITGSLQVELGLRWLGEEQAKSVTFELSLDAAPPMGSFFTTARSASCPFHQRPNEILAELPVPDATIRDLLDSVNRPAGSQPYVALDWPICCRVRCQDCGSEWAPMQRSAIVRRRAVCPSCGSRSILELESIRIIERYSAWAEKGPSAFGLPGNHLYTVRFQGGEA